MLVVRLVLAAALLLLAVAARAPAEPLLLAAAGRAPAEQLLLASAVSMREPMTELGRRFEASRRGLGVSLTFGASSFLAAQIRAGAPVDVLVSADERIVDGLEAEGLVARDGRAALAHNRLVVLVAEDAGIELAAPDDLLRREVGRIAVPHGAVPVGRYARQWLASRGLLSELSPRLVPTEHARATLAAVDLGHADAAIVYATDARLARSALLAFEIDRAEQPRIVYAAALITGARPRARELFAFLLDAESRDVLRDAGFSLR